MTKAEEVTGQVTIVSCPKCGGPLVIRRSWNAAVPPRLVCQGCGHDPEKDA